VGFFADFLIVFDFLTVEAILAILDAAAAIAASGMGPGLGSTPYRVKSTGGGGLVTE